MSNLATRFAWHPSRGQRHRSDVLQLSALTHRRVDVVVGNGQVVLVLRDGAVQAVLRPGTRSLAVGATTPGQGTPSLEPHESADCLSVAQSDLLLYLPTEALPTVAWSLIEDPLAGEAVLRIADAKRFYESFLRHSEDIEEEHLLETLGRLLGSVAERWLAQRGGGIEFDSPAVAAGLRGAAAAAMSGVGLELETWNCHPVLAGSYS